MIKHTHTKVEFFLNLKKTSGRFNIELLRIKNLYKKLSKYKLSHQFNKQFI